MLSCDRKKETTQPWGCCMILYNPDTPNKMLVCKRAPGERQEPGTWGFVGGKVDMGETAAEAVIREVQEEIGITVNHYKYIGSFQLEDYTDFIFACTTWSGEIVLDPNECSDYAWVTREDLRNQIVCDEPATIFSFTQASLEFYDKWCDMHSSKGDIGGYRNE